MLLPLRLIDLALTVMVYMVILSVVFSWLRMFRVNLPHYHPIIRAIEQTADLIVAPIRRSFPTGGGGIDFAPMIAIILLYILKAVVRQLAIGTL